MHTRLALFCSVLALLPAQTISEKTIPPAGLQEDLRVLRGALEEGHPGIYRYTPQADLNRIFQRAADQLNRPMTVLELYRILAPAVAALRCGHTPLLVPDEIQTRMADSTPLLPVDVRVLSNRVYVFRDYSEGGHLAGAEILSINSIPAKTILDTLLASIHGDGDSSTAGPFRLARDRNFARVLYTLAGLQSPFRIHYSLAGKEGDAVLDGLPGKKIETAARSRFPGDAPPAEAATFRLIDGPGVGAVGVLKVYQFGGTAASGKSLNVFFQDVYNDLQAKGVRNLIIDVRNNGGGADELGKQLFSYLVQEPFPYYNDLVINKLTFDFFRYSPTAQPISEKNVERRPNGKYLLNSHPNWGTQQPGKPYFGGIVIALMNGGSFSTTCEFLSTLYHHKRATFIGEEAAGGYYGNTSGPRAMLVLPNSKIRVPVPLMTYYMAIEGSQFGNRSIPPDRPITYSIEELLAGRDKEMEAALQSGILR